MSVHPGALRERQQWLRCQSHIIRTFEPPPMRRRISSANDLNAEATRRDRSGSTTTGISMRLGRSTGMRPARTSFKASRAESPSRSAWRISLSGMAAKGHQDQRLHRSAEGHRLGFALGPALRVPLMLGVARRTGALGADQTDRADCRTADLTRYRLHLRALSQVPGSSRRTTRAREESGCPDTCALSRNRTEGPSPTEN